MAAENAVKTFFSSPHFAVVGASSDTSKFGHKIFRWYTDRKLDVIPINPSAPTITALSPERKNKAYDTLPNLSALPYPKETAVSIITPPKVTIKVLEEAKKLGIESVWLQPGTYDDDILKFARNEFKAGIGGEGGGGGEGWCVLVDGDYGLEKAGKGKL